MSASNNPDFWRSQEGEGKKKPPTSTPSDSSSPFAGNIKSPLTDSMKNQQSSARSRKGNLGDDKLPDNGSGPRSGSGRRSSEAPTTGANKDKGTGPTASDSRRKNESDASAKPSAANSTNPSANRGTPAPPTTPPKATAPPTTPPKATAPPTTPPNKTMPQTKAEAAALAAAKVAKLKKEAAERKGSATPQTPPPEVLSKETAKAALKEGAKQGVVGGAKGAATGGLHGAAAGAAVGGVAGAADKINEAAAARKQAGTSKSTRSASGIIAAAGDKATDKALDSGRAALQKKYGATAATAKSKLPINPQQAKSIGKASITVQQEVARKARKNVAIAAGLVGFLGYSMIMTVVGATTAPIAAAIIPIVADDASCEAPTSVTVGNPSPGDKGTDDGLTADAKKVRAYINSQWGGRIADIYGVRQGANAMDHASGRALDIMIPNYKSPEGKALGDEISKYFQDHSKEYGINYLIFDNKIWANGQTPDSPWSYAANRVQYGPKDWAPYGSTSNDTDKHLDHVHISVMGTGSSGTTTVSFSNKAQSLDMTRAANISPLVRVPVPLANFAELNSNPTSYGLAANAELRAQQLANARAIIGKSKTIGFNKEGAVIGVMTAMTESDLINVDRGDNAINPDGSMNTSRGLFQQQFGKIGWGTKEEVMNPSHSSQAFFLGTINGNPGLQSLPTWKSMEPWMAAQKVQRSAFSDGSNYKTDYEDAKAIVEALYDSADSVPMITGGTAKTSDASHNTETTTSGCTTTVGGDGTIGNVTAGDTYPARNESYGRSSLDYAIQCADSVAGGCRGECVDWAAWKLVEYSGLYGTHRVAAMGNATDIGPAARAKGIAVDMNPVAGDAVYWTAGRGGSGSAGHIGTVQAVNGDGTVTIEEYNFGGDTPATGGGRYHTRTIPVNDATGYIHFIDPNKSKEENVQNLISKGILVAAKGTWPRS